MKVFRLRTLNIPIRNFKQVGQGETLNLSCVNTFYLKFTLILLNLQILFYFPPGVKVSASICIATIDPVLI